MARGPQRPPQYRSVKRVEQAREAGAYWVHLTCGHAFLRDGPNGKAYADGVSKVMKCYKCMKGRR